MGVQDVVKRTRKLWSAQLISIMMAGIPAVHMRMVLFQLASAFDTAVDMFDAHAPLDDIVG